MLTEASPGGDPARFKDTELFKKCRSMGIIPAPEDDLALDGRPPAAVKKTTILQEGPETADRQGTLPASQVLTLNLQVHDMWCPACAWVIEERLKRMEAVGTVSCCFTTDSLRCHYDPVRTSPHQIIEALKDLGYGASIMGEESRGAEKSAESVRFGISAFLTVNIMMLSFALYSGFFTSISEETIQKLSWPIFAMSTAVLVYGGKGIRRKAWAGIKAFRFGMETLIAAGAFSAYLYSTFNLFAGSIHLYYDTAAMLITLVLLGKMLERKAIEEIRGDLSDLHSLSPRKVRICTEIHPEGRHVSIEQLREGDLFRVDEDEVVPADGVVLSGTGLVDESSLTGEALPRPRKPGDQLRAGSRTVQGIFRIKAQGVGAESTLGRMIAVIENALACRTSLEGKTQRALEWFAPMILLLAAGTGAGWALTGLPGHDALIRAITVMVISCPCALGIAIPLARVAGLSLAKREGILIHDFSAFERAQQIDTFVFDKTGTVTDGRWTLQRIVPLGPLSEAEVLSMAAALEEESDHYIAAEIRRRAKEAAIAPAAMTGLAVMENGISGRTPRGEARVGARCFVSGQWKTSDLKRLDAYRHDGEESLVFMSYREEPCAVFAFGDKVKPEARQTVRRLLSRGYKIALLSGDGNGITKSVGRKLGIEESYGEKLPHEKASFVAALQERGRCVAAVGDGVNDAPVLAQADLAVSVRGGIQLGHETVHVTLVGDDLGRLPILLNLAKRVNRKVRQNLVWTFAYNAVAIPLAMSGLLTPLIAVCAMLLSSISVTANTLMLVKSGGRASANALRWGLS